MKTILIILILLMSKTFFAQPPGIDDSIMAIKKKWTTREPFVGAYDPQLKPSVFPVIYKKTDSIGRFIKEAYPQPIGSEAMWYASILSEPYFKGGPSPYQVSAIIKYFFYSEGLKKIIRNDEPGTGASIYVNSFRFLVSETGLTNETDGRSKKLYEVMNTEGEWKGYPIYRIDDGSYKNYRMKLLTQSGVIKNKAYDYRSRFEDGTYTNPEELIAAAHAGCFSMKLSFVLGAAGFTPSRIETKATVTLESGAITGSHLEVKAKVPKLKAKDFPQYAEEAKNNCPVSKALGAINVTMDAQLVKTFKVKEEAAGGGGEQ